MFFLDVRVRVRGETFLQFGSSPTHAVIRRAIKMFHSMPIEADEDGFNKFPPITLRGFNAYTGWISEP